MHRACSSVLVVGIWQVQLGEDAGHVLLDLPSVTHSGRAIPAYERPRYRQTTAASCI
jgi:hypothetical protein